MKKNFAMRIAACLLVVTMLSLCMVSYTYAKYTTAGGMNDQAKVAKWGITLTVTGDNLLYNNDLLNSDEVIGHKVTSNNLAAPGTYQKLATVALTGTPEVSYTIKVDVNLELNNWIIKKQNSQDTEVYCPLIFSVDGTDYVIDDYGNDIEAFELAIENAIRKAISENEEGLTRYDAGTAVPETANEVLIDWTWDYAGARPYQTDIKDTKLGNNAADSTAASIDFSLLVTITQED